MEFLRQRESGGSKFPVFVELKGLFIDLRRTGRAGRPLHHAKAVDIRGECAI